MPPIGALGVDSGVMFMQKVLAIDRRSNEDCELCILLQPFLALPNPYHSQCLLRWLSKGHIKHEYFSMDLCVKMTATPSITILHSK
jgi:hypothetical protein